MQLDRAISESSDSSDQEQNSSDKSDFYDVNLYDSDVVETSEPSEDTGPRPCRYEPRRVQGDDGQQQQQSREDETESETDRLGNTEW